MGDLLALGPGIADCEPTDRKSVEGVLGDEGGGLAPEVGENATLNDREQGLLGVAPRREAAERPAVGSFHCRVRRVPVRRRIDANVEHHHDVRADRGLHLDRRFGRQHVLALIDVAAEARTFFRDRAVGCQREDLVAAGVGEDGTLPAHVVVNPAHALEQLGAGTQHQVVRVAQQNVRPGLRDALRQHRLDRRRGAHRHKGRGPDHTARRLHLTLTRAAIRTLDCKPEPTAPGGPGGFRGIGGRLMGSHCSIWARLIAGFRHFVGVRDFHSGA